MAGDTPRIQPALGASDPVQLPSRATLLTIPLVTGVAGLLVHALDLDQRLLLAVNAWPRATGADPWAALSILGEGSVVMALGAWVALRRPGLLLATLLTALLATLAANGVKELFSTPRPLNVLAAETLNVIGPRLRQRSFPSGHACAVFAATLVCWTIVRTNGARLALLGGALLISLSRLAVGAHWPVDVLAGAALGWLAAGIGLQLAGLVRLGASRRFQICAALLPVAAALRLILARHEHEYASEVELLRQLVGVCALPVGGYAWWRIVRTRPEPTAASPVPG